MRKVNNVQMSLDYPIFRCYHFGDIVRGKLHLIGSPVLRVHTLGHCSPVHQVFVSELGQTPNDRMSSPVVQMPIVDDREGQHWLEGGKDPKPNPQHSRAIAVGGGGLVLWIPSELDENYVQLGEQRVDHERQVDAFDVMLNKVDGLVDQVRGENLVDGEPGAHKFRRWVNAGHGQQEVQQGEYELRVRHHRCTRIFTGKTFFAVLGNFLRLSILAAFNVELATLPQRLSKSWSRSDLFCIFGTLMNPILDAFCTTAWYGRRA
jgi:hypothetical protein